jgi:DNA-directed RNA polymerase specialized sigma24 family protein
MQKKLSLNYLYECYTEGRLKKIEFETAAFELVKKNLHCYGLIDWTNEEKDDYLSILYRRIGNAINNYQETGSSFANYIGSLVRLTAKEFRSCQARTYTEETTAWVTQLPDMYVHEEEEDYCADTAGETNDPEKPKNPRQLLILILKCCRHVSMELLEKASPVLGIETETLCKMIDILKEQGEKRKLQAIVLRERINRQFLRCVVFEKRLRQINEDSIATERLKKQLEEGRDRLKRIRSRLARKNLAPSNSQIAQLLGISKSTVDSTMNNLRKRFKKE